MWIIADALLYVTDERLHVAQTAQMRDVGISERGNKGEGKNINEQSAASSQNPRPWVKYFQTVGN